jgi:hypothetical protein
MDPVKILARTLAQRRLERDRKIAADASCPAFLKLDAYLPQCPLDAAITIEHCRPLHPSPLI